MGKETFEGKKTHCTIGIIGYRGHGKTKVNKYQLNGNRQKVRETAVCRALTMVRHALVEEFL